MGKKIIVIGGGIAGLAMAYECLLRGDEVLLVERTNEVGGISRSIKDNDCLLDIGAHIINLKDKEVFAKVNEIVPREQMVKITRKLKLYIKGRFIDWPPSSFSALQLPVDFSLRILLDQLFMGKKTGQSFGNFRDELIAIYGSTLYYNLFDPLTRKFLKEDPASIHADWAFSSLRTATKIEDRSFKDSYNFLPEKTDAEAKKDFNLIKFLINSVNINKEAEKFYYFKNGFGTLTECYKEKILALGGRVLTSAQVEKFSLSGNRIKECVINGENYQADQVIWTGYLFDLCQLLEIKKPNLEFLHSKIVYFYLKQKSLDHQSSYYIDPDISFSRATLFANFSPTVIHNNNVKEIICFEHSIRNKEELSGENASLVKLTAKDAIKAGLIDDESDIVGSYVISVMNTYPILKLNYKQELAKTMDKLKDPAFVNNLAVFGRQAEFSYDNVDTSIKSAINHPLFKQ
ncbi:MAG: FAD-dependent oxidoreductase [bacterium]